MKLTVNLIRILTGILFIFSGLVKAIDPLGLSYKMQEFFEAWASSGFMPALMHGLTGYSLSFSVVMITLEVVVGMALILGWRPKITTRILLLLILFFTFLTAYVLFSGKIRSCGCFGDCIPITPIQTFTKDIILLIFSIILVWKHASISQLLKEGKNGFALGLGLIATLLLQFYVLHHLPLVDCLPFKKGNNILELRKMPPNAIMDEYAYEFVYEKEGRKVSYTPATLPDSSWNFVERKQTLIKKGSNNIPLINDFNLSNADEEDVTEAILNINETYFLLFMKDLPGSLETLTQDLKTLMEANKDKKFYIITSDRAAINTYIAQNNLDFADVFTCDGTAIKTAARVNPTLFKMQGPVIQGKWAGADIDEIK